jgi:type IV pilus assembly protein PilZ
MAPAIDRRLPRAYASPVDDPSEQRTDPRAPIELKVEYKKLNTFFADYTKNISKGGTFIRTDRPLPVGTEFLFKLTLPNRDRPFELRGNVIWTNQPADVQNPDVQQMGMGIRFIFDSVNERDGFELEVERMMVESLGANLYEKLVNKKPRQRYD